MRSPARSRRRYLTVVLAYVMAQAAMLIPAPAAALTPSDTVAYLDRQNNLWLSQDNGDGARQVTTGGGFTDIVWSPDGSRIATTGPYGGGVGVYLTAPDAAFGLRGLAAGHNPAWAPDSTRVALIDGGNVHIFDREGVYERTVSVGADVVRWSSDGRSVGFTRVLDDPYGTGCPVREIGWLDALSGDNATVARSSGKFAWTGDGRRLLYVSADDGTVRSYDIATGQARVLSSRLANPCNGPFFTDVDGRRLFFLESGGDDLVALDVNTLETQVFPDLPVGYPANALPESYVTVDTSGHYAYLVRAYPTTVTRLDLHTGARDTLLSDDYRMFLGFSADHRRVALIDAPYGKPTVTTVRDVVTGEEAAFANVGWLSWEASAVTPGSVLAWDRVWNREDRPVAAGAAQRTWIWGPAPFTTIEETYNSAPGGDRAVRYYDKSRMEITTPAAGQSTRWYVTNGLLATELISGRLQVGDATFIDRPAAAIPVAGDPDDQRGPTYASLQSVLGLPPTSVGAEIHATIDRNGTVGSGGPGGVTASYLVPETNHTVASVFWEYLNSEGAIWDGTAFVNGRLFEPTFFATGFPITEAYWTRAKVAGQERDVLVQCFERRCLTYTPANSPGWQVEMGNIGRHYYTWRYGG